MREGRGAQDKLMAIGTIAEVFNNIKVLPSSSFFLEFRHQSKRASLEPASHTFDCNASLQIVAQGLMRLAGGVRTVRESAAPGASCRPV